MPPDHDRVTDGLTPGVCGYADSSAVHVLSRASLDGLNRRLADAWRTAAPAHAVGARGHERNGLGLGVSP